MYIYIYVYIEREIAIDMYIHMYIYIYIYTANIVSVALRTRYGAAAPNSETSSVLLAFYEYTTSIQISYY